MSERTPVNLRTYTLARVAVDLANAKRLLGDAAVRLRDLAGSEVALLGMEHRELADDVDDVNGQIGVIEADIERELYGETHP